MNDNELKQSIIKDIKKKGSESIKIIAERYEECQYIPRRKTRKIISELIKDKILVRVDDIDCFGNKVDDVVINEECDYYE